MKLTKVERLMISNQLKILERLYPEESEYYEVHRKAIEQGFKLHYEDVFASLSSEELEEKESREVLDILSMYRAITFSYQNAIDKKSVSEESTHFEGFDGNDEYEIKLLIYTRYFILDLDRFVELKYGKEHPSFNSHWPMLDSYRSMLELWNLMGKKNKLSIDEIIQILERK